MLLPLYVLCYKIAIKKKSCLFSSLQRFCKVSRVHSQDSWMKIWKSLSHYSTSHTIGAKRLNLGFFCLHVCGLSHFEDLIRLYKIIRTQRKIFWRKFVNRLFWGTIDFNSKKKNTIEVNGAPELLCFPHSSEYLPLCSAEQRNSYWFGAAWGWVNDDRIFFFGWTIPLNNPLKPHWCFLRSPNGPWLRTTAQIDNEITNKCVQAHAFSAWNGLQC